MKLWKRNAVVAAIALFVCVAVYLNWSYGQEVKAGKVMGESALVGAKPSDPLLSDGEGEGGTGTTTTTGYFASARLNRKQARDSALSLLQEAMADDKVSEETVEGANLAIQTMAAQTLSEAQIENLVIAKGYTDCVAFLGESSISVVVSATEQALTDADIAKIREIVTEQTGLTAEQIKIMQADQ